MRRAGSGDQVRKILDRLRTEVPDITLRTTLLVGFPGETEEDAAELPEFIHEYGLGRLGAFPYSHEEGTPALGDTQSRMPWWSRSVDSTYLTGKRVFIFGDATHAVAAARIARDELGFEVCGLGCYNREFAREVRAAAKDHGVEPLITDVVGLDGVANAFD